MFKIHFTNFGYWSDRRFATLDEAIAFSRSRCFEVGIYEDHAPNRVSAHGPLVASWSPLGGLRTYQAA